MAAIEEQSLSGAARRLGTSPSSVSQHVANLETSLGVTLIDRAMKPFGLTQAGKLFHRRALSILDEIGRARAELARLDASAVRELSLAVIEELEPDVLPAVIAELSHRYTACNIIVRAGQSHDNLAALEHRSVDMIVTADADHLPDWVERHAVLRDPLVLVTARGHDLASITDYADLLAAPMVRFTREQMLARQIEAHLRRIRLSPPRRFEVETNRSLMATMTRERGWGVTTALGYLSAGRFHDDIEVAPLPAAEHARTLTLCARSHALGTLPQEVAELLRSALRDRLASPASAHLAWLGDAFAVPETP